VASDRYENKRVEGMMSPFSWDLRYALRTLYRSPGFALTAVLSLGLGIGANTAIFSLLNALILRPLAVPNPQELVRVGPVDRQGFMQPIPGPMFNWLMKDPQLEGVCGARVPPWVIEVKGEVLQVAGHALSGDCYAMLGIRSALGRLFTKQDDVPTGPLVAVLSYAFWQKELGADPSVIGQTIRIQGAPFRVIGVTEPRFQGLLLGFPPSVSIPITQERNDPLIPQKFFWGDAFARLKRGLAREQVQARLNVEWRESLGQSLPPNIQGAERTEMLNQPVAVIPAATGLDYSMRNRFKQPLLALLSVCVLVLLISCLNLANLLLARRLQKRREVSIRSALGATRWDIVRQIGAESLLVVAAGVVCAILLANVGARALLAVLSEAFRGFTLVASPDMRVFAFASATAVAALSLFGLLPACDTGRDVRTEALKGGPSTTGGRSRAKRILICGQVALTLTLLVGASFFVKTLRDLHNQSFGFQVDRLLTVQLLPLPGGYAHEFNGPVYYRDLLDHIGQLPVVQSTCLSKFSPLFTRLYRQEIRDVRKPDVSSVQAPAEMVSDGFLATMQIPLLQGQDFRRTDSPQSQKTAIVSKSLAARLFPANKVIGEHIRVGSENETQDVEIVGVAADARLLDPHTQDLSFVYLNYWQYPDSQKWGDMQLRYSGDPGALISALRRELPQAGHEFPMYVRTVDEQRDICLLQERLLASVGGVFGILALTLAGVGLFGLLTVLVANRTHEIGIRMALGAGQGDISRIVLRELLVVVGAGLLMGLPLSYATMRILSQLVYGVRHFPIAPLALAIPILLGIAGIAAVIPVRQATSVDPMVALKYE
jgi:putative ABC transport system permease protein